MTSIHLKLEGYARGKCMGTKGEKIYDIKQASLVYNEEWPMTEWENSEKIDHKEIAKTCRNQLWRSFVEQTIQNSLEEILMLNNKAEGILIFCYF